MFAGLCGCGDNLHPVADAARSLDAPACFAPTEGYSFPGGSPCGTWGTPIAFDATLLEENGTLSISPAANIAGAVGGCARTDVILGVGGVFVEISAPLPGTGTTALEFSGRGAVGMHVRNGILAATDLLAVPAQITYDPIAMRWWRIRIDGLLFDYEFSRDGKNWTLFANSITQAFDSGTIHLTAATESASATPGTALIETIDICPL